MFGIIGDLQHSFERSSPKNGYQLGPDNSPGASPQIHSITKLPQTRRYASLRQARIIHSPSVVQGHRRCLVGTENKAKPHQCLRLSFPSAQPLRQIKVSTKLPRGAHSPKTTTSAKDGTAVLLIESLGNKQVAAEFQCLWVNIESDTPRGPKKWSHT